MNKKLIMTGKAVLSTVMASTITCSMLSTSIYAQESEVVPEEETTVVEQETLETTQSTTTEEATDVVEEESSMQITNEQTTIAPSNEIVTFASIDYKQLDNMLKMVNDGLRDESEYSKDSWAKFKPVYDKAVNAKSDSSLTQKDVDQLAIDLITAFMGLRIDPGADVDLDIIVTTEKTDHNTVIVSLDSEELLVSPESSSKGEVNTKTWVYHYANRRYVYQKEYTQNGEYTVACEDINGNKKDVSFTVSGLEDLDYTKLLDAIKEIDKGLEDKSHYTEESWNKFEPLYEQAKNAWQNGSLTQEDIDKLAEDLLNAYHALDITVTDLKIDVSMVKTEWNTVIVTMESNIKLVKPDAGDIGAPNPNRWLHFAKDGKHYYDKEFTQNGTYTEYCEDTLGNKMVVTFVIDQLGVTTNEAPVINATDKTLTVGDKFDPKKDVTAIDKEDGDITKLMTIKSNVDTRKVGEYEVTYTVTDSQGTTSTKTIKVTVKAKAKETKKDKDKDKVNTAVGVSTGLFASMTVLSALGMTVLKSMKKRDE